MTTHWWNTLTAKEKQAFKLRMGIGHPRMETGRAAAQIMGIDPSLYRHLIHACNTKLMSSIQ